MRQTDNSAVRLGQIVDKYELTEVLGSGSFATVYKCSDATSLCTRPYAIKIISKQHLTVEQLALTRLELDIQGSLPQHQNILNLIASDETDDFIYLVLEYCPNGDLYDIVSNNHARGLSDSMVKQYFTQILAAVDVCHKMSVFHRDLKPENLLVAEDNFTIKLADFGLSTNDVRSTELGLGTQSYLAPECLDESIDYYLSGPADIFALGIILLNLKFAVRLWRCTDPTTDSQWAAFAQSPTSFFARYYPHFSPAFVFFLRRVLDPNPHTRASLDEAHRLFNNITYFDAREQQENFTTIVSKTTTTTTTTTTGSRLAVKIFPPPMSMSALTTAHNLTPLSATSHFNLVIPSGQVCGSKTNDYDVSWASDLSDLDFGELMSYDNQSDEEIGNEISEEEDGTNGQNENVQNLINTKMSAQPVYVPTHMGTTSTLGTSYVSVKASTSSMGSTLPATTAVTPQDWTLLCDDDDCDDDDFFDLVRQHGSVNAAVAVFAAAKTAAITCTTSPASSLDLTDSKYMRDRRDSLDSAVGHSISPVSSGFVPKSQASIASSAKPVNKTLFTQLVHSVEEVTLY